MSTPLERLLALASVPALAPTALGRVVKPSGGEQDERDAHALLASGCGSSGCSWYAAVCDGQNQGDPGKLCTCPDTKLTALPGLALTPRTPEASTVPEPTVPPGGPGLFHVKGMELPPYIQHLYKHLVGRYGKHGAYRVAVGIVKKWAAGVNPGGFRGKDGKGKHTHPDVQAAAAKNVAQWEVDKARAHHQGGRHDGDEHEHTAPTPLDRLLALAVVGGVSGPPRQSMLGPPQATAPGARPLYAGQLKQQPSQTVAAGPPLPPDVKPPTPEEIRALAQHIGAERARTPVPGEFGSLLGGAQMQAEAAAHKMSTGDVLGCLHVLRSAQAGIHSHAQQTVGASIPAANVFSSATPPAAQASAQASWQEASRTRASLRALHMECSQLIDRIRRYHFHGNYGSISQQTRWL